MFYESKFYWRIPVQPHRLGSVSNIQNALVTGLLKEFDTKSCTKEDGYLVTVTSIEDIGDGIIHESTGDVNYPVTFSGLTFKPVLGEVVLAMVIEVDEKNIGAEFGPGAHVTIENSNEGHTGKFRFEKEQQYYECEDGLSILDGTIIRVELIKVRWDIKLGFLIEGSLKGEYLGRKLSHAEEPAGPFQLEL